MQKYKIAIFDSCFFIRNICGLILILLTVSLYGRQNIESKHVTSNPDQALVALVDMVKKTGLRFDLYQADPESWIYKVTDFFESDAARLQREDVQKVIDEVFYKYEIFGAQLRKTILKNVSFVLKDNALQVWINQNGIILAQKIADEGYSSLTWQNIEQVALQHGIALPVFHTRAHEAAVKSYVLGYLKESMQQNLNVL